MLFCYSRSCVLSCMVLSLTSNFDCCNFDVVVAEIFALLACYDKVGVMLSVRSEDDDVALMWTCPYSIFSSLDHHVPSWPGGSFCMVFIINFGYIFSSIIDSPKFLLLAK